MAIKNYSPKASPDCALPSTFAVAKIWITWHIEDHTIRVIGHSVDKQWQLTTRHVTIRWQSSLWHLSDWLMYSADLQIKNSQSWKAGNPGCWSILKVLPFQHKFIHSNAGNKKKCQLSRPVVAMSVLWFPTGNILF